MHRVSSSKRSKTLPRPWRGRGSGNRVHRECERSVAAVPRGMQLPHRRPPGPTTPWGAASSAWLAPSASGLMEVTRPPAAGSGQGDGRQIGRRTWHPTPGLPCPLRAPVAMVLVVAASWASGRPRSGCHHTAVAVPGLKADHMGGGLSGGATSQPVPPQTPHGGFTFSGPAVWARPVLSQKMHRMRGAS